MLFETNKSIYYRPETEFQKSTIEFLYNPDLTIEQREKISNVITAYSEIAKERVMIHVIIRPKLQDFLEH